MLRKATLDDVVRAVTVLTDVDYSDMAGRSNIAPIVEARQLVAIVARRRLDASFPDIAVALGRGPGAHASVQDRYRRASELDALNERCNDFARKVDAVSDMLSESVYRQELREESKYERRGARPRRVDEAPITKGVAP